MKLVLEAPGTKRLKTKRWKLKYCKLLSSFAFNVRRYNKDDEEEDDEEGDEEMEGEEGAEEGDGAAGAAAGAAREEDGEEGSDSDL
jgi:hypothetical protein